MSPTLHCKNAPEKMSASLDGELSLIDQERLDFHLVSCDGCRREMAVLRHGSKVLREHLVEPAENFEWKLQLRLQKELRRQAAEVDSPPRKRATWWMPLVTGVAAAALVVAVGLPMLPSDSSPELALPAEPDLSGAQSTRVAVTTDTGWGLRPVSDTRAGLPASYKSVTREDHLERVAVELDRTLRQAHLEIQRLRIENQGLRREQLSRQDAAALTSDSEENSPR